MAGFLSKFFKPKWQNASSSIRLQAVNELDPSNSENQTILTQLLEDESEDVRLATIAKIQSPDLLIAKFSHKDAADKPALLARINELANQLGLSLFDLVENKQTLAQMIVTAEDGTGYLAGLARLEDESALLMIASQAQSSKIRQAASELIESEEPLQTLSASSKSRDKRVYQIVKTKLAAIKERQKQHTEKQQQLDELASALEAHKNTEAVRQYEAKLKSLKQKWETLKETASEQMANSIEQTLQDCEKRAKEMLEQANQEKASELASQQSNDELLATIKLLEETQEQLESVPCALRELPALDALLKTQETRWIESARGADANKQDQKQYQQTMQSLRSYLKAMNLLASKYKELEQVLETPEGRSTDEQLSQKLRELLSGLDWPESYEQPDILKAAYSRLGEQHARQKIRKQEKASLVSDLQDIISQLDKELEDKQYNNSKQLLKKARNALANLEPQSRHAFQSAINLRSAQLNELKDWLGYASSKRQHELCDAMEKLIDVHLAPNEKARKIKELQDEWKALGGAEDETLWQRFSNAADSAFEPCAEYFKEQNALREQNLEKRKTLLEELSTFVEGNDWSKPDWKAVETINRKARTEWRDAYPVEPRKGKPLQKQFNAVLDKLDAYLKTEKDKNLLVKQDIIAQAQALLEDTPLNEAMKRAKELQTEWQNAGITDHKKERALWKKFRAACDAIFGQRDAERKEAQKAANAQFDASQELCAEIEVAAKNDKLTGSDIEQARKDFRVKAKAFNELSGKQRSKFQDRYSDAMKMLEINLKRLQSTEILDMWREAQRKSNILSAVAFSADIEKTKTEKSPEFDSILVLSGALESRFKSAWKGLGTEQKAHSEEQARELCIRCEIAAGIESPEEDQELRMQLQVSRLSEGLSGNRSQSREEQIRPLLIDWYCDTSIDPDLRKQYEGRVWQSIERLYDAPENKTTQTKEYEGA